MTNPNIKTVYVVVTTIIPILNYYLFHLSLNTQQAEIIIIQRLKTHTVEEAFTA